MNESGERVYANGLCILFTTFGKFQVRSSKTFDIKSFTE